MNRRASLPLFYIVVMLFAASDMAIIIAMVWYSLDITKSTFLVGVTLCISTIVPFVLEKWLSQKRPAQLSLNRLVVVRLIAFASILLFALMHLTDFVFGFLIIALIVGMTDYFTISTLESQNTKLVLAGMVNSDKSARFMQTAIQVGAFGGDFLGGVAIDSFSVTTTLTAICGFALVSLGILLIPQVPTNIVFQKENLEGIKEAAEQSSGSATEIFWVMLALGMVGFHIGAFNSLVPIVFQQLNTWGATSFGIASGLAGVGAFLAAIIPGLSIKTLWLVIGIAGMDAALVYSPYPIVACSAAFLIGFCINQLRIGFRKYLIEQSNNNKVADALASRSTFFYLLLSGAAPMILTLFTTNFLFGVGASRPLMISAALALALVVIVYSVISHSNHRFIRGVCK